MILEIVTEEHEGTFTANCSQLPGCQAERQSLQQAIDSCIRLVWSYLPSVTDFVPSRLVLDVGGSRRIVETEQPSGIALVV